MRAGVEQIRLGDPAQAQAIRAARERYLSGSVEDLNVRKETLRSWERSRQAGVDPDKLAVPFESEVDADSALSRAARPVLERLVEQFRGAPLSSLLTDCNARLIARWVADDRLGGLGCAWKEKRGEKVECRR